MWLVQSRCPNPKKIALRHGGWRMCVCGALAKKLVGETDRGLGSLLFIYLGEFCPSFFFNDVTILSRREESSAAHALHALSLTWSSR
jgi:hypothetical protein